MQSTKLARFCSDTDTSLSIESQYTAYAVPIGSMKTVLPLKPAAGQLGGVVVPEKIGDGGATEDVGAEQVKGLPQVEICVVTQVVMYLVTLVAGHVPGPLVVSKETIADDEGVGIAGLPTGPVVTIMGTRPHVTQRLAEPTLLVDTTQPSQLVVVVTVPIMTAAGRISSLVVNSECNNSLDTDTLLTTDTVVIVE